MAKRSAAIRADILTLKTEYEAIVAKNDPAHDDELREMDVKLAAMTADYSARLQDEQLADSNRAAMKKLFDLGSDAAAVPTSDGPQASPVAGGTLGDRFLADPQFKAWLDNVTNGGTRVPNKDVRINSPTVDISGSVLNMQAALISGLSSTSGGALVVNDRTNILVPAVRSELRAVDLLTRMTTTSDTVEYVRVGTETNAAAPVLEATSVSDGAKPESTAALAVVTAIVENIAHYINITRRAMADAGQLRAYINDFLMWGLLDALNDQVVNGTGSTPQLQGIDDLSGKQAQAYTSDLLTTTRKARTLVRIGTGGATPTAYLMNPADWETIDLLQDANDRFFFGGPQAMGTPFLWGLPVVEDEAVDAGVAWVGDWRFGVIWDREQANILMTDSHSDYFIRNILTLLAEMRVALGWLRPAAFVEIDLTP